MSFPMDLIQLLIKHNSMCICFTYCQINNSLYLAWKYAQIFVCRHYQFWETNSFLKAQFNENYDLWGTDIVKGQKLYPSIFLPQWRLLCLLSLKYFLQHAALKTGEYHSHVMHLDQLLYIELTISFLTGITHTVNFQYQRLWCLGINYTRIISRILKVMGNQVMYDCSTWFVRVIMSNLWALCCLPSVKRQKQTDA